MAPYFKDRAQAGHELASELQRYRSPTTLVLGLPRGGVVVAGAVARDLGAKNRRMPIAHKLPLAEVAKAHRLMEQGGIGGKIVLIPVG